MFHPFYTEVSKAIVDSLVVGGMTLTGIIDVYSERWGFKDGAVSAALAAQDYSLRYEHWAKHANSFYAHAGKYLAFVVNASPFSSQSDEVRTRRLFGQVSQKLLRIFPNAADPEIVFSELGRMIIPSGNSLEDAQGAMMMFIAAECREKGRFDKYDGQKVMK
jgi:hypothetical protein